MDETLELKKIGKIQFCQQLSGSLLTSERISEMYTSYSGIPGDSDQVIDDDKLLDAYAEVFSREDDIMATIDKLRNDPQYAQLTKGFRHVDKTYENLANFLAPDKGECRFRFNENVQVAVSLLRKWIGIIELQPIPFNEGSNCIEFISNPKAVCGTIAPGYKKDHLEEISFYALKIRESIKASLPFRKVWIPAKGGHRAQLSGLVDDGGELAPYANVKEKDRFVWVIDGGTGVVEAQYSMPLTNLLKSKNFFSPGKKPYEQRKLLRQARWCKKYWTSIDYSKFDQTLPAWLLGLCFDIIKGLYDEQYHRELSWIAYNFIHTKAILPGGNVVMKDHGIPSGSGFTQIVGTIANMIIMLSYLSSLCSGDAIEKESEVENMLQVGFKSNRSYSIFAQGDDNIVFTNFEIDLSKLAEFGKAVFGVVINPDKCETGKQSMPPSYLKRYWRDYGEYQNPHYLIANTVHPENHRKYDSYSPWHILYCLYLTYKYAFPSYCSEDYFIIKMAQNGGVKSLLTLPRDALPGVAKAFPADYMRDVFSYASRREQKLSAMGLVA